MGFGPFSTDTNTVQQTLNNAQTASQSGNAIGATIGNRTLGAGSHGNITGDVRVRGGGKGSTTVFNVQTPDEAAIAAVMDASHVTGAVALAALDANQKLSTQAIGFANLNASEAFQALAQLGSQTIVAQAGGSPGDINAANQISTGQVNAWNNLTKNQKLAIGVAGSVLAAIVVYKLVS